MVSAPLQLFALLLTALKFCLGSKLVILRLCHALFPAACLPSPVTAACTCLFHFSGMSVETAVVFSSPLQVRCGLAFALRRLYLQCTSVCLCEPLVQNTCQTTLQRSINTAVIGTEALTSSANHNTIYQAISARIKQ